jgi:hypothetical protein
MQCLRCPSDNVELATIIVERETQYVSGGGSVGGKYVSTSGTSMSDRARRLTADKPKEATWGTTLIAFAFCLAICFSCCAGGLAFWETTVVHDYSDVAIFFFVLIPVITVLAVIAGALIRMRYRRVRRHWYQNKLSKRYYCYDCGAIFQN